MNTKHLGIIVGLFAIITATVWAEETNTVTVLKSVQSSCNKIKNVPTTTDAITALAGYSKLIADPELKTSLVVTYALGMQANGRNEEAKKALEYIRKTFSDSADLSLFDTSRYTTECQKCNGTGQSQVACKRCSGKGKCTGCGGRGKVDRLGGKSDRCAFCKGSGKCPACQGSGQEAAKCAQCYGSGHVISAKLLNESFLASLEKTRSLAYTQEQKAKGLVEVDGQWMTPQEKAQQEEQRTALAKAQQADSERKLAEEKRKQIEAEEKRAERTGTTSERQASLPRRTSTESSAERPVASAQRDNTTRSDSEPASNLQQQNSASQGTTSTDTKISVPAVVCASVILFASFIVLCIVQTRVTDRKK